MEDKNWELVILILGLFVFPFVVMKVGSTRTFERWLGY